MIKIAREKGGGLGEIIAGHSYPWKVFGEKTGLGGWGLRMAKRRGLRVRRVGRANFVLGQDWHDYLATLDG